MLMDIATEEFGHLEIVGATIQMLLGKVNGEMKDALEDTPLHTMMSGKSAKEELIHQAFTNPQFLVGAPGQSGFDGQQWKSLVRYLCICHSRTYRGFAFQHGRGGSRQNWLRKPSSVDRRSFGKGNARFPHGS